MKSPLGVTLSRNAGFTAFALIWIAGMIVGSIIVPSGGGVFFVGSWAGGPLWVPIVFIAYALGRRAVTGRLVLVFAIAETVAVWWANAIVRYF